MARFAIFLYVLQLNGFVIPEIVWDITLGLFALSLVVGVANFFAKIFAY